MAFGVSETQTPDDSIGKSLQFKSDRWGLPAILIMGLFMATISWNRWADLIVDYGQQLYIPWQISEGKVLYRDLDYLFGPFSAYLHALLFKLFGVRTEVLVWFNLGLVGLLSFIIYKLFEIFSDTLTATLCTLAFLGVFAFGQYLHESNFNFICAYVYELPHGIFLSFLTLYTFSLGLTKPSRIKWGLMGLLTGLTYLTKPEVFLALSTALACGIFLLNRKQLAEKNNLLLFSGTFLLPPVVSTLYFSTQVPFSQAVGFTLLPWLHVFGSNISDMPMYKSMMGTDFLADNTHKMFLSFFIISGIFLGIAGIRILVKISSKNLLKWGWTISFLFILSLVFWYSSFPGFMYSRSLPLVLSLASIVLVWKLANSPGNYSINSGLLVLCVFSFVLLLKTFFNVQVIHYGFALTLPATLVFIYLILFEFPKWKPKGFSLAEIVRPVALTLVTVVLVMHIHMEFRAYDLRNEPVGKPGDRIIYFNRSISTIGPIYNAAINYLAREIPEGTSFAAIPGSIMLNFMTRRESSLKYTYLDPGAIDLIGEYQLYRDLQDAAPPYVVMTHQVFIPQGKLHFGKDFGRDLHQWILENYDLIQQFGAEPFTSERFGIQIYKHKLLNKEVA